MQYCKKCEAMVPHLFTVPSGERLCDYCSDTELRKPKRMGKKRQLNSTKLSIRTKYGSIKKWSEKRGFNPVVVNQLLNNRVACYDMYTKKQDQILVAMLRDGFASELLADRYINSEWV